MKVATADDEWCGEAQQLLKPDVKWDDQQLAKDLILLPFQKDEEDDEPKIEEEKTVPPFKAFAFFQIFEIKNFIFLATGFGFTAWRLATVALPLTGGQSWHCPILSK